ncbi:MAG TPA: redoxin family protein [Elusimicrobiota bacterium]|nr:redoxin family protein [Elusimicrobiota bacterium]
MRHFLLAFLLAAPLSAARATSLEDAQDNFETAVRTYVGTKSKGGYWISHLHGKVLRLAMTGIESDTVHRSAGGRWRGIVDFQDAGTKRKFSADVSADLSTDLWDVKEFHWLSAKELADARLVAMEGAKASGKPRVPGPGGLLPEVTLPALDGKEAFLPDCTQSKCLTVVVAPWCPHCRAETGVLNALQDYLPAHDVGMRVIVAAADEDKVNDFAKSFGPHTLVDPSSQFHVPGFPCFIISEPGGAIQKQTGSSPEGETDPALFASALGLP